MVSAPKLLNDDGDASLATVVLMSHHGLRRDIQRFGAALSQVANGDVSKAGLLRAEWHSYREKLHGHHAGEDTNVFPFLKSAHPALAPVIDRLSSEHRQIEPLLQRGDQAFEELPSTSDAAAVVAELRALLDPHLAAEEAEIIPFLRAVKELPQATDESLLELYVEGFAWSSHGIAPEVLERVYAILPDVLTCRLPEARAAFDARCERVWGTRKTGASWTAAPDE